MLQPHSVPVANSALSPTESIHAAFADVMKVFNASPAIRFLQSGEFRLDHYKSVLREIYHYTKEDPQLQALAAVYFRGSDRHSVKLFLRHAIAEVGHDLMALEDLKALDESPELVFTENPLPATTALTASRSTGSTFRTRSAISATCSFSNTCRRNTARSTPRP